MLALADIRDMTAGFGISMPDHTYMGRLDAKKDCSIGVYRSKRASPLHIPLGGMGNAGYGVKRTTFLVHWNKSPRDTEKAVIELITKLNQVRELPVNNSKVYFILTTEPIPVDTDDNGIFEMVIDADIYYERKVEQNENRSISGL